jgi:hypothetical protein
VFYRLTLAAAEWVSLDTFGSATDTVLSVLDACGGRVLAGGSLCSDDSGCSANDRTSALAVRLEAGSYVIVVDTYGSAPAGPFELHVGRTDPQCASARSIRPGEEITGDTTGGTSVVGPSCAPDIASPERMFLLFVCPAGAMSLEVSTCGSAIDTVVSLRRGSCTATEPLSWCDDEGCASGPSLHRPGDLKLRGLTDVGGLYFVIVDTYPNTSPGPFVLTVSWL